VTVPPTGKDKTPEEIEREMLQTRQSLTHKVAALEDQVVGTVQTAADTLTGTVESVKELITTAPEAVSETVKKATTAVSETVKKTFDISGHVRERPLTSVGISALLGCVTGWLLSGRQEALGYSDEVEPPPSPGAPTPTKRTAAYEPPAPPAPSGPGVFDEFFSMIGRKLREAAENLIDTASAAVNKNVREGVPKLVDAATEMATERLTPDTRDPSEPRFAAGGGFHG
jgi:ElaB/YqjD/DUF883 family membrane-anchored ribosome-binding protein